MAGTFIDRVRVAAKATAGIFSENSMRQAWGMLAGVLPGGVGMPPTRGTVDYLRAYSQMPWLRAVSSRVSTATARAEWQLFVVRKGGEKKARRMKHVQRADKAERSRMLKELAEERELVQVVEHPMLDVLNDANEFQTGYAMRKITQLHLDLVGDAFWLKERDGQGTVVAVWPIPPHWVVNTPTPAFRYFRVNFRAWRGNIPDTEFIWFSDPDPMNPYGRGSGTAMALGDELDTDEYAARHTKAFFYNSARPDLLVWPKQGNLRDDNVKRLQEDWMQQNQGFFRAFKPYFLNREVGVQQLEQNFRSMTLVQLREFERNVIMQQYGVPPEILGVLENSNRSTIDAADYFMSRYVVEPRLEFQRTVLQERMAPEYDERLIVEYVSPVQEDKEWSLKVAQAAPWSLTVGEWRKRAGEPPLEDEAANDLHMTTASQRFSPIEEYEPPPMPTMPGAPGAFGDPDDPGQDGDGDDEEDDKKARRGISLSSFGGWREEAAADARAAKAAGDAGLETAISKLLAQPNDLPAPSAEAARHEPALARKLARVWRDHASRIDVTALARDLETGVDPTYRFATDTLAKSQTAAVLPVLQRVGHRGVELGAMSLRRVGVQSRAVNTQVVLDLKAVNHLVTLWAEEHAAMLVQVTDDIREIIRMLVAEANARGLVPDQLARMLLSVVGLTQRQARAVSNFRERLEEEGVDPEVAQRRAERYAQAQQRLRAMTIARTETISAINAGQQMLWNQAVQRGAIKANEFERMWIVTDDDLLDTKVCEPLTDARAPLDGPFPGNVMYPPAHPNCRCAMGLVEKGK